MLKSFLKSIFIHIAFAVLLVFAYLLPSTIKKPNKKSVAISFSVPNRIQNETTVKQETNQEFTPTETPIKAKPSPAKQHTEVQPTPAEQPTQAQAKAQYASSESLKQASSIATVPNTLPLYAQAPIQPLTPLSPLQKVALPHPEATPSIKEPSQEKIHTATQPVTSMIGVSAVKPIHTAAPAQPSMVSLPMQKPSITQAEAAPSLLASTIPEVISTPSSVPQALVNAMTTPIATPSAAVPMQAKPNAPASHPQTTADDINGAKQAYLRSVAEQIKKYQTYPREAKENKNIMGNVKVIFRISPDGSVMKIGIVDSSGSVILDKAAVKLILSITRFESIPAILGQDYMDITLNIDYTLK